MLGFALRKFSSLRENQALYRAIQQSFNKSFEVTPNMPSVLRYAWHDAGTYDRVSKTGGPNGSLRFDKELAHGANTGLKPIRDLILTKKAEFPQVSYADLIQAGGYAAIAFTKGPEILFRFGRKDVETEEGCPPEGRLPDASKGADHLRDVFGRMGFNDQEIVALSGGHTLGKAYKHKEGDFEGPWTPSPATFNSDYYIELLQEPPKKELLRLPTDAVLTQDPAFKQWVVAYLNPVLFFQDYARAHRKLSELGW